MTVVNRTASKIGRRDVRDRETLATAPSYLPRESTHCRDDLTRRRVRECRMQR